MECGVRITLYALPLMPVGSAWCMATQASTMPTVAFSRERSMKKDLIVYYADTSKYYATYHNHKEICAWAGLVLYVLFLGLVTRADIPPEHKLITTRAVTAPVLLVTLLVFFYIRNQLEMKDLGGALSGAAGRLLLEIIRTEESKLKLDDYLSVGGSPDTNAQSSYVLPKRLRDLANELNKGGRGFQDRTRSMIYGLLALSTVTIIGLKWIGI